MGFLGIRKPFQKESVDNYQGVLVPLAHANRHPTVAAEYARRQSREGRDLSSDGIANKDKDSSKDDDGEGGRRTNSLGSNAYTVEGLRAEVMEEIGAGEKADSSYDRMSLFFPSRWVLVMPLFEKVC
jgi:hypothetical protein